VLKSLRWASSFQVTNKGSTWLPADHWILSWNFHFYCSYCWISFGVYHILDLKPDDKVYCPMPLYHSAGGILNTGLAITSGITVVIKRKFSASQYFPDCVRHNCTVRPIKIVNLNCGSFCLLLFLAVFVLQYSTVGSDTSALCVRQLCTVNCTNFSTGTKDMFLR